MVVCEQVLDQAYCWSLGGTPGVRAVPATLPAVWDVLSDGDGLLCGCLPAVAMEACGHPVDTGHPILAELPGADVWKLVSHLCSCCTLINFLRESFHT